VTRLLNQFELSPQTEGSFSDEPAGVGIMWDDRLMSRIRRPLPDSGKADRWASGKRRQGNERLMGMVNRQQNEGSSLPRLTAAFDRTARKRAVEPPFRERVTLARHPQSSLLLAAKGDPLAERDVIN